MTTKHTPGPWVYGLETTPHGYELFIASDYFDCPVDILVHSELATDDFAIAEANARLIAAAPELLDILKRITGDASECEMHGEPSQVDGVMWEDILDARAAIAKAEGGAQ